MSEEKKNNYTAKTVQLACKNEVGSKKSRDVFECSGCGRCGVLLKHALHGYGEPAGCPWA